MLTAVMLNASVMGILRTLTSDVPHTFVGYDLDDYREAASLGLCGETSRADAIHSVPDENRHGRLKMVDLTPSGRQVMVHERQVELRRHVLKLVSDKAG